MNIEDLISQYIDGELSSEAEAELHHRLSVSPEDRVLFREHVDLRDAARSHQLQHHPSRAMEMSLFARLAAEEGAEIPEPEASPAREPVAKRVLEPAAELRPLEMAAAAPMARPMAADAPAMRSDRPTTKRRRILPILVPFIIGVAAMGLFWRLYSSPDDMSGQMAAKESNGSSSQIAQAPPSVASSPEIAGSTEAVPSAPETDISSPLSTGSTMSDQGSSSYGAQEKSPSYSRSGSASGRGSRSVRRAEADSYEMSADGGSAAAMGEAEDGIGASSIAPPPPPASREVSAPDRDVMAQGYQSNERGGGARPPVEEQTQAESRDEGNVQSAAPIQTPIVTPTDREKEKADDSAVNQEPRQFATVAPRNNRPQEAPSLSKRNPAGKPTVATPPPAGMISQLGDAYFDPDKATLRGASRESLDNLVDLMKSYPAMRIEIRGHTDSDGSEDRNNQLSESRARSVMEYLRRSGIAAARMEIEGFGPTAPLAPNTTALGKKLNRRVEVRVKDYEYTDPRTLNRK